ncbi:MAG: PQQ-binding-like beta-propeller repeat protein [Bacteroidales bacterium]
MQSRLVFLAALVYLPLFTYTSRAQIIPERQWPAYRGYMSSGVLDNADLPQTFDFSAMTNIRWKIKIPGMGISSPVIWGDKLFLTTAISEADKAGFKPGLFGDVTPVKDSSVHEWKVYCIDKNTGRILWEKTACKGVPKIKRHPKSTHANTTVAVDGKHVVAFFGSEGLYCYDFDGRLLWQKNFGVLKSAFFVMKNAEWEFASSPILHNNVVVVQCDVLENSFLAAYDAPTGREIWKKERDEYPGWCTPNIYTDGGKEYVAVNGYKHRGGYDFLTGDEIWKMSGGGDIQIPTPIIGKDLIYFNSAHGRSSPIIAVKTSARGDITPGENETTSPGVQWSLPRGGSYIHTMLLYRGHLYNVAWNGAVQCLDPATGQEIYNAKLGRTDSFIASPVASDGRIYIVSETGTVNIIGDGDFFNLIAQIPMNSVCMTAPSITDGMIFFRCQDFLYAVGKK